MCILLHGKDASTKILKIVNVKVLSIIHLFTICGFSCTQTHAFMHTHVCIHAHTHCITITGPQKLMRDISLLKFMIRDGLFSFTLTLQTESHVAQMK